MLRGVPMDAERRRWIERVVVACDRAAAGLEAVGGERHALLGDIRALRTRLADELAAADCPRG